MPNNFSISEFIIDKGAGFVPILVVDKIIGIHIPIIQPIRDDMNCVINVSKHSGFRSVEWEIQAGRNGLSEHCFMNKGAVDYTCERSRLIELFNRLAASGKYLRICLYADDGFIHCDLKKIGAYTTTRLFDCNKMTGGSWVERGFA